MAAWLSLPPPAASAARALAAPEGGELPDGAADGLAAIIAAIAIDGRRGALE